MHNISNDYRREVVQSGRVFKLKGKIDFADGTTMELTGNDFIQKGFAIKDDTANSSAFGCGNMIAKQIDLILNNNTGKFSDKDFEDAVIYIQYGLVVHQSYTGSTIEYLSYGPFTADSADVRGRNIKVTAYDYMEKFDRPYDPTSAVYPATLKDIVYHACLDCGVVPLNNDDFNNSDYVVQAAPDGEANTYRDVVSAALQIAGYNGRFDENGKFYLQWYDLENPVWTFSNISQFAVSDTVITGVQISSEVEVKQDDGNTKKEKKDFLYGTDEYAVKISSNILISGDPTAALNKLGPRLVGMRFRTFDAQLRSVPVLEAGDCILLKDRLGNEYKSILTSISMTVGSKEKFSCSAATKATNAVTRFSDSAKAEAAAKKQAQNEISYYDTYAKQFAAMASATVGYYTTEVTQDDGSVILYSHDKPKLEDSKNVWKKTGLVVAVSNNGPNGPWHGLDKDGNAVLNDIAAKNIIADKVRAGKLTSDDGTLSIDLGNSELSMKLEDGSKVVIGKDGFYNMFGKSKNEYFHLIHKETFHGNDTYENGAYSWSFYLPDEFKGKNVQVMGFIEYLVCPGGTFLRDIGVSPVYDSETNRVDVSVRALQDIPNGSSSGHPMWIRASVIAIA